MANVPSIPLELTKPGRSADWRVDLHVNSLEVFTNFSLSNPVLAGLLGLASGAGGVVAGAAQAAIGAGVGASGGALASPVLYSFSRSDYFGRLEVSAEVGLGGGGFTFSIDRAQRDTHTQINQTLTALNGLSTPLIARIYMGWYKPVLVPLPPSVAENMTLVGEFAVNEVEAAVEGTRYTLTLKGRELFAHRLRTGRVTEARTAETPENTAGQLMDLFGFDAGQYKVHAFGGGGPLGAIAGAVGLGSGPEPATDAIELEMGATGLSELNRLQAALEGGGARNQHGRGAYLVRDGVLHIGTSRPIPLEPKILRVTVGSGLVGYQQTTAVEKDPHWNFAEAAETAVAAATGGRRLQAPTRRAFQVTLMGAPDIKPGDVIAFPPAEGDLDPSSLAAQVPAAAAVAPVEDWSSAIELYVQNVSHTLSRNQGFLTRIAGVEVDTASAAQDAVWDVHSPAPEGATPDSGDSLDDGTAEGELSQAVRSLVDARVRQQVRPPAIGEVRRHASPDGADLSDQHSSRILRGLAATEQVASRSVQADVFRAGQTGNQRAPYATPFAWGQYGLVLPRYPGTRVVLVHPGGDATDPVDIGALWHSAEPGANGPSTAQEGDWWLSLPVDQPFGDADISEPILPPEDALASNDLIAADGSRIIEVGQFVLRAGLSGTPNANARPEIGEGEAANGITILQTDSGTQITIDADGAVTIDAAKSITFQSRENIELDAQNVKVRVAGTMDVEKKT